MKIFDEKQKVASPESEITFPPSPSHLSFSTFPREGEGRERDLKKNGGKGEGRGRFNFSYTYFLVNFLVILVIILVTNKHTPKLVINNHSNCKNKTF
jgi:hypothetical protein